MAGAHPWWNRWGTIALVWLTVLAGLYFGMQLLVETYRPASSAELIQGGRLMLKRAPDGHYRLNGQINGHTVRMMIDTGASDVSLSAALADRIGLERGVELRLNTANGVARGWETRLNTLSLGELQLGNVRAAIAENFGRDDEVLIGMNVLGRFRVEIDDNVMTLSPRGGS